MVSFILSRLIQAIPVVVVSTMGVFLLMHLLPGDPALMLAGPDATNEAIQEIRKEMGLDQPLPVQYVIWVGHVLQGDLGNSALSKLPVAHLIGQRAPATLQLAITGQILTIIIALPLGILAAARQRTRTDWAISSFVSLGVAVPNFWLGILFILLFSVALGWLPPGGRGDFTRDPFMALKSTILPALTLALPAAMTVSRLTKASVLDALYEDYTRTAHAKGLSGRVVITRHVLRNALVPIVTALGLQFGNLLGGSIIVESVFAWPGLGTLMLTSIGNRDYLIVQAGLLSLVMVFIMVNILVDIIYGFLDPRIRVGARGR